MNTIMQVLVVACLGIGVALGCGDGYTAPVIGAGCGEEQQSSVVVDGDLRVTRIFITREYTQVDLGSQSTVTRHYRVCQSYICSEVREDPAAALGESEVTAALARCSAEADSAWAAGYPN